MALRMGWKLKLGRKLEHTARVEISEIAVGLVNKPRYFIPKCTLFRSVQSEDMQLRPQRNVQIQIETDSETLSIPWGKKYMKYQN